MLQNIQVANIMTICLHPILHVVAAAATRVDKMVVEVVMTITAIDATIEIRRLTRTLLVIFVNVFLLVMSAAISLVVLMTVRPTRTCVVSSTIPNTALGP
jgi:hypothetical protein